LDRMDGDLGKFSVEGYMGEFPDLVSRPSKVSISGVD
jgi:hypothetical protein